MTLALGARLGPHEIVSPIGAGGMGEVYRARDTRLDRSVAIKVRVDGGEPPHAVLHTRSAFGFLDTDGFSYDVSPDGRFLCVVKPAAPDELHRLHFVTGWFEELRRLVAAPRPGGQ